MDTDLHKKQTDRNQYLLPSSCHPKQTTKLIPYSLGLRIVRICSDPMNRDKRLNELKVLLMKREYKETMIDTALERARRVPREIALRKVSKPNQTKRPVFAVTYDPRLPSISTLQAKHWSLKVSRDQCLPYSPSHSLSKATKYKKFYNKSSSSKGQGKIPRKIPERNEEKSEK